VEKLLRPIGAAAPLPLPFESATACNVVYVLGTSMNCAKTAELIEMPFARLTVVGLSNLVLHGSRLCTVL